MSGAARALRRFFQAEDGIRDRSPSRGLGDVYKRQNKNLSGLNRSKKLLGNINEISVVDFNHTDVVRHPLVSKIVKAYTDSSQEND